MFCLLSQPGEWINVTLQAVLTTKEMSDTQNTAPGTMDDSELLDSIPTFV